ncbi:hypothetical protein PIB30_082650 [Stylosanthes scabra]|uniref:Secreted protein n=1 Tax=Stylosanthes scabra TaxID=79078 RepID=A0ABU6ZQL4_9FABA|nr:hypothetical protein [Stylosanthes scabra]
MCAAVSAGVLPCWHTCISRCVEECISSRGILADAPVCYCRGHIFVSMPVVLRVTLTSRGFIGREVEGSSYGP